MGVTAETIVLAEGALLATVLPDQGGAVGRFAMDRGDGRWFEVFDTRPDASRSGPFALGCNVLAPFSNRISGGGFSHNGRFHALDPNIEGEPYPNHGNAFSSAWQVERQSPSEVSLLLAADGPGPFQYVAQLDYALRNGALEGALVLTNLGESPLPFGGGFHPWFPRTPQCGLRFEAEGVWTETRDHLPDRFLTLDDAPAHDHRAGQLLPEHFTNVAYAGWQRAAEIAWPEEGMGLRMSAESPMDVLMLYTPGADAPFFSLEPVSHTVDAHNRESGGVVKPRELTPGESLRLAMTLVPHKTE